MIWNYIIKEKSCGKGMTAAIADFHLRLINATVLDIVLTQTNDVKADWWQPEHGKCLLCFLLHNTPNNLHTVGV